MSEVLADLRRGKAQIEALQNASLRESTGPRPSVLRVFQLDGERLQLELVKLLRTQIGTILFPFDESLVYQYQDEIDLLLSSVLYWTSVFRDNQFYGDKLQNVQYRDESKAVALGLQHHLVAMSSTTPSVSKKLLHLLLLVGIPYILAKIQKRVASEGWDVAPQSSVRRQIAYWASRVESWAQVAAVANFLVFLMQGKYRSLIDRLLQLRLVYGQQRMNRVVNLDFMNQQVTWSVLFAFLSFFLPLVNLGRLRTWLLGVRDAGTGGACPLCGADPILLPRTASCGHKYCYYCIAPRIASDTRFRCPRCGEVLGASLRPAMSENQLSQHTSHS